MSRRLSFFLLALGGFSLVSLSLLAFLLGRLRPLLPALTLPAAAPLTPLQARILTAATAQIGNAYDASYCVLSYPNGDPPAGQGACTDVVVRSLRAGGYDLQSLVHQDMVRHWDQYPHRWGLPGPDRNIDHRHVPNLARFFQRHGQVLTTTVAPQTLGQWQPGDVVCWKMPDGGDHIGLVADRRTLRGVPLVIHNGGRCREEDALTRWRIAGHYRYPPSPKRPLSKPLPHTERVVSLR